MSQGLGTFIDDEIPLREYLLVPIRKWYLVVGVLLLVVAIAAALPLLMPDKFEVRTRLLIVAPLSERVLEQPGDARTSDSATNLSVETLSALATANDLLQRIIVDLNLRDSATGRSWAIERLAGMMNPSVERAGQGAAQRALPLLTMTVRGRDPGLLKRVADAWAEAFVQGNSELFKTEAARSYNFVASRYEETKDALQSKQQENLEYQQANPLLSVKSQLSVLEVEFGDFLDQLEREQVALVVAQAQLQSAEEAFVNEPQFLTFERAISTDAIWELLANKPDQQVIEAIPGLTISDQERNELHFSLKDQIVSLKSQIATSRSTMGYLEGKTAEFKVSIEELSARIAIIELELSRFKQEITVLTNSFDSLAQRVVEAQIASAEQEGSIRLVESAVEPQAPVNAIQTRSFILAGPLGLLLGVGLAMFVHYLQGGHQLPRREVAQRQPN